MKLECSICFSVDLTADDEGNLVCNECDNIIDDYRREELDEYVQGTVTKNRESQVMRSSLLQSNLEEKTPAPAHSRAPEVYKDDKLLRESIVRIVRSQVQHLVKENIVPGDIMDPLWEIMLHYFKGSRGETGSVQPLLLRLSMFTLPMTLAFLALAGVYVRSPLLPRDLVNLTCTGRLPYVHAARDCVDNVLLKRKKLKERLIPVDFPTVSNITERAILLVTTENYAWPPMRHFFFLDFKRYHSQFRAFPIGNSELTILRMLRELRLPDSMLPRVLRYRELRRSAAAAIMRDSQETPGAGDLQKAMHGTRSDELGFMTKRLSKCEPLEVRELPLDEAFDSPKIPAFLKLRARRRARPIICCAAHDTDYMCIGDIVNTLRICFFDIPSQWSQARAYGNATERSRAVKENYSESTGKSGLKTSTENGGLNGSSEKKGMAELATCMKFWSNRRSELAEDDLWVHWTNLTDPALRSLRGSHLREYISLSSSAERQDLPSQHFWNDYTSFFNSVAEQAIEYTRHLTQSDLEKPSTLEALKVGRWIYSERDTIDVPAQYIDRERESRERRDPLEILEEKTGIKKPFGSWRKRKKMSPKNAPLVDERVTIGLIINNLASFIQGTKAALRKRTPLNVDVCRGLYIAIDQSLALTISYANKHLDGRSISSRGILLPYPRFDERVSKLEKFR